MAEHASLIFRVTWQQRAKVRCACCQDTNDVHQWRDKAEGPFDTPKDAERAESKTYEHDDAYYEVRNVRIECSSPPQWEEYRVWEHELPS